MEKFKDPIWTAKGDRRAHVSPKKLDTLWFNTGTLCNLECQNCYIESSPKNDRLVYITTVEVGQYLKEAQDKRMCPREIGFTGGEPFMNPEIISILNLCLKEGYEVLVLTNATKPMEKKKEELLKLKEEFGDSLKIRVSMDHYSEKLHAKERGDKAWNPALQGLKWLSENSFSLSVAGRTLWSESESEIRHGFAQLFQKEEITVQASKPDSLILFPEMDEKVEVPEITTECWGILKLNPDDMMCASSRMVVKRKGSKQLTVVACTLLPYSEEFDSGPGLENSWRDIPLNHPHCAKFCVLGGGSCSQG